MTILTIIETAEFLKKSVSAIRNYVRNNTIPYHKKNGSIYFIREELEKWVLNN